MIIMLRKGKIMVTILEILRLEKFDQLELILGENKDYIQTLSDTDAACLVSSNRCFNFGGCNSQ
jgi:hypothetical protein